MKYDQKRKKSNTKIGKRLLSTTIAFTYEDSLLLMASLSAPFICILNTIFQILYCLANEKTSRRKKRRKGQEGKSEKLMSRGRFFLLPKIFFVVFPFFVCLIERCCDNNSTGWRGWKRERQQRKQFSCLADRFFDSIVCCGDFSS
jgi:hypothetical protein